MKPTANEQPELLGELPVQYAPAVFVDLYELVPLLLVLYPDWGVEDIENFVEEKTRCRVHHEDEITILALCQRQGRRN